MKQIDTYQLASYMTQLPDKLTYIQVTRKEMSFTYIIFIVIYLPSEVTINYPISGDDIQHFLQLIVISSFRLDVGNLNKLISLCGQLAEHPTIAQFSPDIILYAVCCVFFIFRDSCFFFLFTFTLVLYLFMSSLIC